MALSNWDTIAWNEKKEPMQGLFTSPAGVVVGVRKNWLQVFDKTSEPVLIVNSGSLRYKDVEFYAFRGPQQGVYAIVWSGFGSEERPYTAMFCAGVYGYKQRERLAGNDDEEKEAVFEGVRADSLFGFRMRISDAVLESELPKAFLDLFPDKPLRYNQGDAYFAHHLGHETPATKPGEAQPTTMSRVVGAWSKGTIIEARRKAAKKKAARGKK